MPQDSNFYCEETQEFLGKIPSWIIRWGATLIFLILLVIIIGCCFIKYPERVNSTVTITSAYSPTDVVLKSSGNIERIVPKEQWKVMGIIKVPQNSFGKVKIGQKVNVRLNGYPYMEYGLLTGVIGYISSVPEEVTDKQISPQYTVEIVFPDGMKTSYGKKIRLIQKMNGKAEIITEERSLIMRFVDPIFSLLKCGI